MNNLDDVQITPPGSPLPDRVASSSADPDPAPTPNPDPTPDDVPDTGSLRPGSEAVAAPNSLGAREAASEEASEAALLQFRQYMRDTKMAAEQEPYPGPNPNPTPPPPSTPSPSPNPNPIYLPKIAAEQELSPNS